MPKKLRWLQFGDEEGTLKCTTKCLTLITFPVKLAIN